MMALTEAKSVRGKVRCTGGLYERAKGDQGGLRETDGGLLAFGKFGCVGGNAEPFSLAANENVGEPLVAFE